MMNSCALAAFRRVDDLRFGRVEPSISDIFVNSPAEQQRFLRHNADLRADAGLCHVAQILIIDLHRAAGRVVKARDQVEQCRFARAARPDQRDNLARLDRHIDMFQ